MNMFNTVRILTIILYGSVIIDITTSDFAGCDEETFYSFLQGDGDLTNQNNMHDLIRNMHRNNLRYNQVWDGTYYIFMYIKSKTHEFLIIFYFAKFIFDYINVFASLLTHIYII